MTEFGGCVFYNTCEVGMMCGAAENSGILCIQDYTNFLTFLSKKITQEFRGVSCISRT